MAGPNPDDPMPVGGGSPPGDPLGSLDADERAMKKGKGRMLAAMIVAGVAAVAAVALYLASGGQDAYATFGKKINGLDERHYDAFWGCAFQGYDLKRIRSDQDLRNQLHMRAEQGRARYGAHLRDACLPKLAAMEPELKALVPPEGLAPEVRTLTDSVSDLRGGLSDYIAYLDGLDKDEPYDREAASDQVGRIAKAWYDYGVAFSTLQKELKAHLGG